MIITPKYQNSSHFRNFWEQGNGKELLSWSGWKPTFENFNRYSQLYRQVDNLGDAVVQNTYLKLPYHEASELIRKYSKSMISFDDEAPESLKRFFQQMQEIPEWFDEELANKGARFCMRTGVNALIVLRDFTLMGGYDFAYLNKPLIFTGALKKGAVKRLKDTLEFWVHVTREDGLKINSEAYELIVRTRLMHSYARLTIKKKIAAWNYQMWGEPINSWDMIATYNGFSLVTMQGLKKLGIYISDDEEKGVFHLWKYIGYLLGIPFEYLPDNKKQATEQLYLWSSVQDAGDEDSAHLAKALLEENLENTIYKFPAQRKILLKLHQSMNWYMLDDAVLQRLKIPKTGFTKLFPKLVLAANKASQKILNLKNPDKYRKLVEIGHKKQMKVLQDYLKHTPKDFHY